MKLEYLVEFLALSQAGNYSIVAESLFISDSSLSRHMLALEQELHVELFTRSNHSLKLTEAGKKLIPYAEKILQLVKEYSTEVAPPDTWSRKKLTVGFIRAIIQYQMAETIMRFRDEYPDIDVVMIESTSDELQKMVKNGSCDLAFLFYYPFLRDADMTFYPILRDSVAAAVPANSQWAALEEIRLEQLRNEPFIEFVSRGKVNNFNMQLFHDAGYKPNVSTRLESRSHTLDIVGSGAGFALVEKTRFENAYPPDVKLVPLAPPVAKDFGLLSLPDHSSDQKDQFIRYIQERIGFL